MAHPPRKPDYRNTGYPASRRREFQRYLFDLDPVELRQVFKTFRKLTAMEWNAIHQ